jgi:hypothetical protein
MNKKQKEQAKNLLPVVGIAGVAGLVYYLMRSRRAAQGDFQPMATGGRNRRNHTQNNHTQNSSTAFNPTADWSATNSSSNTERRRLTFRLSADQIRAVQRKIGVTADGKWGMQTEAAFQRAAAADNLPQQIDEPTLTAWLQGRPNSPRPATGTATDDNALVDAKRMHDNIFTNRRLNEAQKMQQAFLYLRGKTTAYRRMIQSSYDRTFGTGVNPSFRRRMQALLNNAPNGTPNKMEFSQIVNSLA